MSQLSGGVWYNLRLNVKTAESYELTVTPEQIALAVAKVLGLPEGSMVYDVRLTPLTVPNPEWDWTKSVAKAARPEAANEPE